MNIAQHVQNFILVIILLIPVYAFSQTDVSEEFIFSYQHWTKKDGLPTWNIRSYFQDKKGQLWLGTNNSLISFDGYEFKTHYTASKSESLIERIQEDSDGNLWFLEKDNENNYLLLYYNPYADEVVTFNHLPNVNKNDFYRVLIQEEELLIFNQKGDFFDKKGQHQFSIPFHSEELHFCFLSGDNIWVIETKSNPNAHVDKGFSIDPAPNFHLFLYQKNGRLIHTDTILSNNLAYSFWEAEGNLYGIAQPILAQKSMSLIKGFLFHQNGKKSFSLKESDFDIQNRNVAHIGWVHQFLPIFFQKNILIRNVEQQTIFYYKGEILSLKNTPLEFLEIENLSHKSFIDNSGAFWLSNGKGLFKIEIQKNKFRKYLSEPAFHYSTRGMLIDHKGNLQAHTYKGTQQVDLKTGQVKTHYFTLEKNDYKYDYYRNGLALYEDGTDLWMGQHGAHSIQLFKEEELIYFYFKPFQTKRIYDIQRVGEEIWVGTIQGIYKVNKEQQQLDALFSEDIAIHYLYENYNGVWAATDKGLCLFSKAGKLQQRFLQDTLLKSPPIKHFFEDIDGTFWLATTNGLIHWHPETEEVLLHLTTNEGLSHNNLHAVYGDKNGFLYISSNYGLMRFHKATKHIKTYLKKDGIAHDEFNLNAHYQAKDGRLFFGGISGITSFYPDDLIDDTSMKGLQPFIISGEIMNGQSGKISSISKNINSEKNVKLSTTQNFLTINLTTFLLEKNPNIEYGWQLGNQNIIIQKDRAIRLNNVNYGRQKLTIKVRQVGQNWSEHTLTIQIHRARPFFLQWWFWALVIAMVGVTIWQFFKYRTHKLEQDKEQLASLVKERTFKIEEQAERLKAMNKAQQQFFTNITHEFRTPLTLIIGPLHQLLKERFSKKVKTQHSMMLKNAEHLQTLINQLLDLSKLESGLMQLEVAQGDLTMFTNDLVVRFQPLAQRKNQTLLFHSSETPFETHFDKEKWNKIIYNLVSNAIKFTPDGGHIQINLTKKNGITPEKDEIHLFVKDNGIGIDEENLKNIFNRFYQIDGSTKRTQEGTGIGLSLVKELVELQGGTIKVESKVSSGTSFEIILPLLSHPISSNSPNNITVSVPNITIPNESTPALSMESTIQNASLDILIIEDNSDMRQYIESCLEPFNYQIRTAIDGEDGIQKALDICPDLIVSDVMMPRKDGYEVVTAVRQNLGTSHVPIILLTAKSSLESRLEGLERGADVYLTKPFSPEEFLLRIRKLIELRQLMQLRYQKGVQSLNIKRIPKLKKEDEFIQNLQKMVLQNLTNDELGSEWLAQQHFISRTNFYKKVKALTGHTVAKFINITRLQEAEKLMIAGEDNLASIAYQVGFTSPSQFSKVCKRILGKSPSEYKTSLNID